MEWGESRVEWPVGGGNKEEEWDGVGNNGERLLMMSGRNVHIYKCKNVYILTDKLIGVLMYIINKNENINNSIMKANKFDTENKLLRHSSLIHSPRHSIQPHSNLYSLLPWQQGPR